MTCPHFNEQNKLNGLVMNINTFFSTQTTNQLRRHKEEETPPPSLPISLLAIMHDHALASFAQVLPVVLNEHRHEILFFGVVLIITILTGASIVFAFESGMAQTEFDGLSNAIWFSAISSLTVGYVRRKACSSDRFALMWLCGDLSPHGGECYKNL